MVRSREEMELAERRALAPYAQFSADSRGRVHPEPPPPHRTEYQRDRDRIIHSRAFRRLEYKTQVFLNGTGDHYRTRLTHTIEVAAIARGIARVLCLNEDLVEAIALAHDLGHPPFGHSGEAVLNHLMRAHGGFEHNRQSLRVVEELERKYPGFPGLNLTWEVREGLLKHSLPRRSETRGETGARSPSLEAQVANLADEITYYGHDLDDGLDSGLLSEKELELNVRIWRDAARSVRREHGDLPDECRRYFIVRCLIDSQVGDVVETSEKLIAGAGVGSVADARRQAKPLIQYSPERRKLNLELRRYLYRNLYRSPEVHVINRRDERMLQQLFGHYLAHPAEIGHQSRRRASKIGLHRAVCDYLAGMTDRYAMQEYQRVFGAERF
jgi:dGTPase